MANHFVHVELQTQDLEKAKTFYQKLFDWKYQEFPKMGYSMFHLSKGIDGGMMKNPVPDSPSYWIPYVDVDDITASIEKAKELGGTVVYDVIEIPGEGWASAIVDPTGATIGLWQSNPDK